MSLRGKGFAHWNHRVLFHPEEDDPANAYYAIHECHYDKRGAIPHSWTENPVRVIEDDVLALRTTLKRMLTACELPVLVIRGDKLEEMPPESETAATNEVSK